MSSRHHTNRISKQELNLRQHIKIIKDFHQQTKCNDNVLDMRFNGWYYRYALKKYYQQRDI